MNKHLHFLKQLKRAAMSTNDFLFFYQAVVRPVAEYACRVWHPGLTVDQSDRIESIQRRAMKIIFNVCVYIDALQFANFPLLAERHDQLTRRFFDKMCDVSITCCLPSMTVVFN